MNQIQMKQLQKLATLFNKIKTKRLTIYCQSFFIIFNYKFKNKNIFCFVIPRKRPNEQIFSASAIWSNLHFINLYIVNVNIKINFCFHMWADRGVRPYNVLNQFFKSKIATPRYKKQIYFYNNNSNNN